jgi:NodT family efflux transporter outer membrane factor (OMF) lipoprotein
MRNVVTAVFVGLAASACAVGPDFVRPDAPAPARLSASADFIVPDGGSVPVNESIDERWWMQFSDPLLDSLEARAMAANLDMRVAALRLAQSREQRVVAAAARSPGVNQKISYQRQRQSEAGVGTRIVNVVAPPENRAAITDQLAEPFDVYQPGFDASWELDLWGRVRRSVESADASLEAATAAARDVRLAITAELARGYLELRGVQRQLEIAEQDVTTGHEMLELIEQRASGGLVTDLDAKSQSVRLAQGQARVTQLRQQLSSSMNAIALLLGEQPGSLRQELSPAAAMPTVPSRVPIGVSSEVARRRPDIREAEARLHAATADIGIAVADLYPRVTLMGSLDTQALDASDVGEWSARQWSVGPSLSVPLFDGGRRRAVVELRKVQQQEAAVNYQRTVLRAWHEIDDALTAYASEQQRHRELAEAVTSSRAALEIATTRYQHGLTNFLVALDAQRTLLQTQRDYADSATAICTRLVALYKALGGGWREEAS